MKIDYFSRTAAAAVYITITSLFWIVGLLGLVEALVYQSDLLLHLIPLPLATACLLVSFGFFFTLLQWRWWARLSGILLLATGAISFYLVIAGDNQLLASAPMGLIISLIMGAAVSFVVQATSASGRMIWRLTAVAAMLGGCYMQLQLWFPILALKPANPITISILSVVVLLGGVALWIHSRYKLSNKQQRLSKTALIAALVMQAGYAIWFVLTLFNVQHETTQAELKIATVSQAIVDRLESTTQMFRRAQERWLQASATELPAIISRDGEALSSDYPLIDGVLLLRQNGELVQVHGLSDSALELDMFKTDMFVGWLQDADNSVQRTLHGGSLQTPQPLLLIKVPLPAVAAEPLVVVALINVQRITNLDYLRGFPGLDTYVQLTQEVLVPLDAASFKTFTLNELQQQFPYYLSRLAPVTYNAKLNFVAFLTSQASVRGFAQLNQLILWASLAFCFTFILAADRSKQLRHEKSRFYQLARYDEITGLLRRDALRETMNSSFAQANNQSMILFIDLDGFKPVNDSLGHSLGDQVLKIIGARISRQCPINCSIARFSSDEFIVFSDQLDEQQTQHLAENLLAAVRQQIDVEGFELHLTASIGIAHTAIAAQSQQQLIQLADVAMSAAKQAGGNTYRFFVEEMADNYRTIVSIRNELQKALDRRQLKVVYQPIIDLQTGAIVSVESLVRWQTDTGSHISPAVFIPIAERTGQIIQLGELVVQQVLADIGSHSCLQSLTVAINVSSQQLKRYPFADFLEVQLQRYGVNANKLVLELTESDFIEHSAGSQTSLASLTELGCSIAIDDFGTGYSSLSYLYQLPADCIKFDRSFTQDVLVDAKQARIVTMLVTICQEIGKQVVIEGVETAAMANYFREIGCNRAQGYFYARPMTINELEVFLQNHSAAAGGSSS
ncbi:putative bifunctional diguanylate cyclase/phosphodiesterase [Pseudidiomarina sp. WS423]|uniref:putative bifunctional diguanylate cyclase/phosphodiesterase n=1 Tax=Pseudidiomarina sp. WS423 TaxID=3425124 RepID=UPI003D6FE311